MEEVTLTVTTGRKNSISILRKLSHPALIKEEINKKVESTSKKKIITGVTTIIFILVVVVIRPVQIFTTSSIVEGDMLWRGFILYLEINGLICLVLMVALYLLLSWKEGEGKVMKRK